MGRRRGVNASGIAALIARAALIASGLWSAAAGAASTDGRWAVRMVTTRACVTRAMTTSSRSKAVAFAIFHRTAIRLPRYQAMCLLAGLSTWTSGKASPASPQLASSIPRRGRVAGGSASFAPAAGRRRRAVGSKTPVDEIDSVIEPDPEQRCVACVSRPARSSSWRTRPAQSARKARAASGIRRGVGMARLAP